MNETLSLLHIVNFLEDEGVSVNKRFYFESKALNFQILYRSKIYFSGIVDGEKTFKDIDHRSFQILINSKFE